jgi:polar amino acid transport system substrate-binding protein
MARQFVKRLDRGLILAFAVLLALAKATAAQESLRVGYFDLPPHVIGVEGQHPKGAAIGYFEEYIAPHLGVEIVWDPVVTPPTRLMKQLETGEKDAMIFLGWTKERTAYLHYPRPYLILSETMAFRAEHPLKRVTAVDDLQGLRVGFLVGGRIPDALRDERITYDLIAGKQLFERNLAKLLHGRIDAIYAPLSVALERIIEQERVESQVKLLPIEFLNPVEIYTVFSKKTVSQDLIARYNDALEVAQNHQSYIDYIETYGVEMGVN